VKGIVLCFMLASCSAKQNEQVDLPIYSDMGAAADAGKTHETSQK